VGTLGLSGCSSSLAAHPPGSPTVADAYTAAMRGDTSYSKEISENNFDNQVVHVSRTNLPNMEKAQTITHEPIMGVLNAQFPMLPNPQSKMYVFGHFAGDGQVPVAGHFVPFSLYTRNYYALPNEVLMPYNDGQFIHPRNQFDNGN
jgi:conjugative transfer region lipoprotein (TIGR03751 family)